MAEAADGAETPPAGPVSDAAQPARLPPMLSIVGCKHAGKTTLLVRLCAELTRRGRRVMTLKHGSHTFNLDPAATDTYRHYHEGGAERVAMASPDKFALVTRWDRELSPEAIVGLHLSDADLVLCEGFKTSDIPKVEIYRREAHDSPLWAPDLPNAASWRAMVVDAPLDRFSGVRFELSHDDWLHRLADWVEREFLKGEST